MPRRLITSEIFRNEKFGSLTDAGRLFFIGCFSNADDEGRLRGSPKYLKALFFPYDNDKTAENVLEMRNACQKLGLIYVYNINEAEYLYCIGWEEHQVIRKDRRKESNIPAPNMLLSTVKQPEDNQVSTSCQPVDNQSPSNDGLIQYNTIQSIYNNNNNDKNIGIIFQTFEDNFQRITETTKQQIMDFVDEYGSDKVLVAMNSAIKQNKRSLAYVEGILEKRGDGTHKRSNKKNGDSKPNNEQNIAKYRNQKYGSLIRE